MDVYVLEHKHFHAGIKITEDGEFLRWNNYQKTYEGMASPLEQNERHIQVLKDVMAQIELPTRLGVRIPPSLQSFVLVGPEAKIYRPKRFDASRVVKADQLKKAIWRDFDNENPPDRLAADCGQGRVGGNSRVRRAAVGGTPSAESLARDREPGTRRRTCRPNPRPVTTHRPCPQHVAARARPRSPSRPPSPRPPAPPRPSPGTPPPNASHQP